MAKRKRETKLAGEPSGKENKVAAAEISKTEASNGHSKKPKANNKPKTEVATTAPQEDDVESNVYKLDSDTVTVQIITGSYERVLHGFTAAIPRDVITSLGPQKDGSEKKESHKVDFSDTFLFNAHTSAIRCLALSPNIDNPEGNNKIFLASGSTDQRINLYSISTRPPAPAKNRPRLPNLHGNSIAENRRNKELGSLLNHEASITGLYFPSRSKLMSSAEDCHLAITRTRDWVPLTTIKAPIPVVQGRPSGDTAGPGEVPSGINDFSVHPSMKLMVSVSKGEKCMRLWNLLTGKKAGVLTFSREILNAAGEGRFGTGEGRKVEWDADGEEFIVAFERGAVAFGIDCQPTATILPSPRTKLHQMKYLPGSSSTVAFSTEDGRIIFYDTKSTSVSESVTEAAKKESKIDAGPAAFIAQIGGPAAGISGRVKDFAIFPFANPDKAGSKLYLIVAASSDGSVRLWTVAESDLKVDAQPEQQEGSADKGFSAKQVGQLVGTYSTGTRITCLASFVMTGQPEEDLEEAPAKTEADEKSEESSSAEDSE
ncbi:WD40 repeat-like protein [Aaosphaeria arxii CBS 175.79]|uniref:WD40 repeat-like protein n=1 Tax=Aaosphaeria arxii CBS 175.79 TaxID=1450172 RepID=A0A6A5XRD6_9PLEO|nr:WD40 repeat-like protein [Aaosphaeria arxii CBS 175.79]KAF2015848.1 WD40 repeat-like protein [Aaosphaeria arxii CBS 175.79]